MAPNTDGRTEGAVEAPSRLCYRFLWLCSPALTCCSCEPPREPELVRSFLFPAIFHSLVLAAKQNATSFNINKIIKCIFMLYFNIRRRIFWLTIHLALLCAVLFIYIQRNYLYSENFVPSQKRAQTNRSRLIGGSIFNGWMPWNCPSRLPAAAGGAINLARGIARVRCGQLHIN